MTMNLHRRDCLRAAPLALMGAAALSPRRALGGDPGAAATIADSFPSQDPTLVREMVGASHGNVAKVTALLKDAPQLAKAAYDWGFGDWETALGAASHVGNREIAELLIARGARPDLFTFAMLGDLDAVRAAIVGRPGIQRLHGPHGLTLMHHARQGGDGAKPVVEYLAALGDADVGHVDLPLDDSVRGAVIGEYVFGAAPSQRLQVFLPERQQRLSMRREAGTARALFHQGDAVFHPAGAPDVRIAFAIEGDRASGLAITAPGPVLQARRAD